MRTRLLISTSVLIILIGAIFFAWEPRPSSAQDDGFQMYQLNVFCEGTSLVSKIFTHSVTSGGTVGRPLMGTKVICVGSCGGNSGPVTLDAALAGLPAQVSAALRAQVDRYQEDAAAGTRSPLACLPAGKPPAESGCEKPTPWFDSSQGCTDIQKPQITTAQGGVTLSICGLSVFRGSITDSSNLEMYALVLTGWVQSRVGSRVCCNRIRDAARTAKPCDPSVDVDCDGILNQADLNTTEVSGFVLPQIDLFTVPPGATIDKFPDGLNPDDPDFMPNRTARDSAGVGECACKWDLIKGELKCSPDGKQQHVYVATWRCRVTKAEVMTTKYAPASAPCSKK